ncbi:hypothetical protein JCM1840_001250 [Sporobolomyces johnsonii]
MITMHEKTGATEGTRTISGHQTTPNKIRKSIHTSPATKATTTRLPCPTKSATTSAETHQRMPSIQFQSLRRGETTTIKQLQALPLTALRSSTTRMGKTSPHRRSKVKTTSQAGTTPPSTTPEVIERDNQTIKLTAGTARTAATSSMDSKALATMRISRRANERQAVTTISTTASLSAARKIHTLKVSETAPIRPTREIPTLKIRETAPIPPTRKIHGLEISKTPPIRPTREIPTLKIREISTLKIREIPTLKIREIPTLKIRETAPIPPTRKIHGLEISKTPPIRPARKTHGLEISETSLIRPTKPTWGSYTGATRERETGIEIHGIKSARKASRKGKGRKSGGGSKSAGGSKILNATMRKRTGVRILAWRSLNTRNVSTGKPSSTLAESSADDHLRPAISKRRFIECSIVCMLFAGSKTSSILLLLPSQTNIWRLGRRTEGTISSELRRRFVAIRTIQPPPRDSKTHRRVTGKRSNMGRSTDEAISPRFTTLTPPKPSSTGRKSICEGARRMATLRRYAKRASKSGAPKAGSQRLDTRRRKQRRIFPGPRTQGMQSKSGYRRSKIQPMCMLTSPNSVRGFLLSEENKKHIKALKRLRDARRAVADNPHDPAAHRQLERAHAAVRESDERRHELHEELVDRHEALRNDPEADPEELAKAHEDHCCSQRRNIVSPPPSSLNDMQQITFSGANKSSSDCDRDRIRRKKRIRPKRGSEPLWSTSITLAGESTRNEKPMNEPPLSLHHMCQEKNHMSIAYRTSAALDDFHHTQAQGGHAEEDARHLHIDGTQEAAHDQSKPPSLERLQRRLDKGEFEAYETGHPVDPDLSPDQHHERHHELAVRLRDHAHRKLLAAEARAKEHPNDPEAQRLLARRRAKYDKIARRAETLEEGTSKDHRLRMAGLSASSAHHHLSEAEEKEREARVEYERHHSPESKQRLRVATANVESARHQHAAAVANHGLQLHYQRVKEAESSHEREIAERKLKRFQHRHAEYEDAARSERESRERLTNVKSPREVEAARHDHALAQDRLRISQGRLEHARNKAAFAHFEHGHHDPALSPRENQERRFLPLSRTAMQRWPVSVAIPTTKKRRIGLQKPTAESKSTPACITSSRITLVASPSTRVTTIGWRGLATPKKLAANMSSVSKKLIAMQQLNSTSTTRPNRKLDSIRPRSTSNRRGEHTTSLKLTTFTSSTRANSGEAMEHAREGSEEHRRAVLRHHRATDRLLRSHQDKLGHHHDALVAARARHAVNPTADHEEALRRAETRHAKQERKIAELHRHKAEFEAKHHATLEAEHRREEERRRAKQKEGDRRAGEHEQRVQEDKVAHLKHVEEQHRHDEAWRAQEEDRQKEVEVQRQQRREIRRKKATLAKEKEEREEQERRGRSAEEHHAEEEKRMEDKARAREERIERRRQRREEQERAKQLEGREKEEHEAKEREEEERKRREHEAEAEERAQKRRMAAERKEQELERQKKLKNHRATDRLLRSHQDKLGHHHDALVAARARHAVNPTADHEEALRRAETRHAKQERKIAELHRHKAEFEAKHHATLEAEHRREEERRRAKQEEGDDRALEHEQRVREDKVAHLKHVEEQHRHDEEWRAREEDRQKEVEVQRQQKRELRRKKATLAKEKEEREEQERRGRSAEEHHAEEEKRVEDKARAREERIERRRQRREEQERAKQLEGHEKEEHEAKERAEEERKRREHEAEAEERAQKRRMEAERKEKEKERQKELKSERTREQEMRREGSRRGRKHRR